MDSTPPASGLSVSNQSTDHQDKDQHCTEDVYKLSPHVPIAFDDTFKESEAIRGFSFMKKVNGIIYEYTHFAVYASLSLIIAPLMAIVWGLTFAINHVFIVWLVQPSIKAYFIWLRICNLLYEPTIRLFLDPLTRSASLMYSGIKGQFKMNSSDLVLNMKTSQV